MAYGDRHIRSLEGFGFTDYISFAGAGSLGMISAIAMDMRQSADASALYVLNKWVTSMASFLDLGHIPLYGVVLLLMAVGAAAVLYLQPSTMQSAFAQGFGLLAALMTIAPADLGGALDSPSDFNYQEEGGLLPPSEDVSVEANFVPYSGAAFGLLHNASMSASPAPKIQFAQGEVIEDAVYRVNEYQEVAQEKQRATTKGYDVVIKIKFEGGLEGNIDTMIKKGTLRARLHNPTTKQTFNMFRSAGAIIERKGEVVIIRALVPGGEDTATLWARVECNKHKITIESFDAKQGRNADWNINVPKSSTPMFMQRLRKSYWF